jgi:hypothetical protein
MSLRSFHLLFIALSVILTAFFAAWAVGQYRSEAAVGQIVAGISSLAAGAALAAYGVRFQRRTRSL